MQAAIGAILLLVDVYGCLVPAFEAGDLYRGENNVLKHRSHYMAHCMASCLSTRCVPDCGIVMLREQHGLWTLFVGAIVELVQATPWGKPGGGGWGNSYWRENMDWNIDGVKCGLQKNTTCFQCCLKNAKRKGQLGDR